MSTLVIDGTVMSILPVVSKTRPLSERPSIETQSMIAVNEVLKGSIQGNSAQLVLSQMGGKSGDWDVVVENDALVEVGQRYILFLIDDKRPNPQQSLPHYVVTGVWSGKVLVSQGRVTFAKGAAAGLRELDGMPVQDFIQTIRDTLHWQPTKDLPIHPSPPKKP